MRPSLLARHSYELLQGLQVLVACKLTCHTSVVEHEHSFQSLSLFKKFFAAVFWTHGWHDTSSMQTCYVFVLLFLCVCECMATLGFDRTSNRWNSFHQFNSRKMSPDPPSTECRVANGWNLNFFWTLPLKLNTSAKGNPNCPSAHRSDIRVYPSPCVHCTIKMQKGSNSASQKILNRWIKVNSSPTGTALLFYSALLCFVCEPLYMCALWAACLMHGGLINAAPQQWAVHAMAVAAAAHANRLH